VPKAAKSPGVRAAPAPGKESKIEKIGMRSRRLLDLPIQGVNGLAENLNQAHGHFHPGILLVQIVPEIVQQCLRDEDPKLPVPLLRDRWGCRNKPLRFPL
jgi:hypothetical protein